MSNKKPKQAFTNPKWSFYSCFVIDYSNYFCHMIDIIYIFRYLL
ncbi:hypothetical protein GMES_3095 [Paraglaciecola mesophila KMM 241]|uniref:Uncharacterized protein n=1 Tax=Paraglaciecola mesophila KMM 241 TaxID=1128912 RepID=K6XXR5_9ALTE|nr:hypothetical protein GMES_3095 [Paraglaciecola mesophila KMM 241]